MSEPIEERIAAGPRDKKQSGWTSFWGRFKKSTVDLAPATFREAIPSMNPKYVFYRHNSELVDVLDRFINAAIDISDRIPELPRAIAEQLEPGPLYLGKLWDLEGGPEWWRKHGDGREPLINAKTGKVAWRLIVTFPPRHGKSETISCLLPAYYAMRHPDRWVAICSYGAGLAYKLSKIARSYFLRLGGRRDRSMFQVRQWMTDAGGGVWATGRGGEATGKGWMLGICDDMLKDAREATSALIRERLRDWYQSVFYTRAEPPALEIQVSTRWHPEDLIGWQLSEELVALSDGDEAEGWYVVDFPSEAQPRKSVEEFYPPNCAIHPDHREVGAALWPEKYNLEKLKRILRRIGEFFYNALFLQRPTLRDGDIFHVERIEIVAKQPPGLPSVRAWDHAYSLVKRKENAESASVKIEGPDKDGHYYIVDAWSGQLSPGDLDKHQRQTARMDGTRTIVRGPEDPAAGKRVAIQFIRNLVGFIVRVRPVNGDKALRCQPLANECNIGMLRMVQGPWNKKLIEAMRAAPNGKWDLIDAAADAHDELANHLRTQGGMAGGQRPDTKVRT